jgi:hypothetical protein
LGIKIKKNKKIKKVVGIPNDGQSPKKGAVILGAKFTC